MRKITFLKMMLLAIVMMVGSGSAWGQTTYTWNAGSTDFGTAANWTPTRTTPATTDILVFNNGTTNSITGVITQTIGGLLVSGNTIVNLNSTVASTLTIGNGVSGFDLSVENGSQLNVSQTSAVALIITLATNATGSISGSMNFSSTTATSPGSNQIISTDASGLTFKAGAVFTQNTSGYVFGTAVSGKVIFSSGSTFIQVSGSNPLPGTVTTFQTASLYKFTATTTPSFSGKTYANFELNSPGANLTTTGGSAIIMDNLTITAGTLNFNMTGTPGHSIKGNISVASGATLNFTPASPGGTVNLNGTSLQTISGNGTITTSGGTTLSTLIINNSAGVVLDNNSTLAGNLSISSGALTINPKKQLTVTGILTNNGTLNLLSDATGTATILTPATIGGNGTVSVQQYLSSARNWYISSPVTNATSPAGYTYFKYDEPGNNSHLPITLPETAYWENVSTGTSLSSTVGYIAQASGISTITFTGSTLNTGNITTDVNSVPTLTSTPAAEDYQGFNLIGNPYPSFLDISSLSSNADLVPTYWMRSNNSGYVFDTYNIPSAMSTGLSGYSVSSKIPPMQAFWVCVKSTSPTASIAFTNAMRSHQDDANNKFRAPKSVNSTQQVLRLQVSNGTNTDETIIYSNNNASNNYDDYDSPKMSNGIASIPGIYTVVDGKQLAINGYGSIPTDTELPLGFTTGQSNAFTIKASQFSNFDTNTHIILKDNQLGIEQDLTDGSAYTFSSDITTTASRFSVIFKSSSVTTDINNPKGNDNSNLTSVYKNANGLITINCSIGQGTASVYNAVGQKLYYQTLTGTTTVISKTFTSGVYFVNVIANGKTATRKIVIN